jgi:two-component system response regulator PilR (NtrC family)
VEKILVVDDEQSLREVLSIMLKRTGYAVTSVADGEEAIELLNKDIFDLVITDLRMPKIDGMEVLKAAKSASPETVVLIITAFASADSAVEAMKQGA